MIQSNHKRSEIIFLIFLLFFVITFFALNRYYDKDNLGLINQLEACLEKEEQIVDYVQEDHRIFTLINNQGKKDYGDFFAVFEIGPKGDLIRIYENDFVDLKPWKMELADVDGDGVKEILIAVQKATLFDDKIKNRMFIMNYENNLLIKKWTGSQIAGIWRDFYTGELISVKGDELIFVEVMENERERISVFSWFDFGFFLIAKSKEYPEIRNITLVEENQIQMTWKGEGKEKKATLKIQNGELIEVEERLE